VPLIVISPYAKARYISTAQHEFGSILKLTELVFGSPSLGTTRPSRKQSLRLFRFLTEAEKVPADSRTFERGLRYCENPFRSRVPTTISKED
jgi:hypothetical protein